MDTVGRFCYHFGEHPYLLPRRAMDGLRQLNLIHFLDFYFAFMFFASTYRRFQQYQTFGRLAFSWPGRWPRLLKLIGDQRTIFLTWKTAAPALLALGLWMVQLLASRLVWPEAGEPPHGLELQHLFEHWPVLMYVAPVAVAMLMFDMWGLVRVGQINQPEMVKYFDQAEFWLRSATAHVVKMATLGFINPRKMVNEEVRKALVSASDLVNYTLWWVSIQTALRFTFGLTLWVTWAMLG